MGAESSASKLLGGSFDKINWARHHVQKLNSKIDSEIKPRTYQLSHEINSETGDFEIVWDPPALDPEFGLRIGDAVHQLRSALDLAVWELTGRNGVDPETLKRPRPQFPIFSSKEDFDSTGVGQIRGVTEALQGVIRENQPYHRGDYAHQDPLAILADLSNTDKHRIINPVQVAVEINTEAIERVLAENVTLLPSHPFVTPTGSLLKPRQTVVRLQLGDVPPPQMQAEAETSADVALTGGALVIPALNQMGIRAEGVIRHLIGAAS